MIGQVLGGKGLRATWGVENKAELEDWAMYVLGRSRN